MTSIRKAFDLKGWVPKDPSGLYDENDEDALSESQHGGGNYESDGEDEEKVSKDGTPKKRQGKSGSSASRTKSNTTTSSEKGGGKGDFTEPAPKSKSGGKSSKQAEEARELSKGLDELMKKSTEKPADSKAADSSSKSSDAKRGAKADVPIDVDEEGGQKGKDGPGTKRENQGKQVHLDDSNFLKEEKGEKHYSKFNFKGDVNAKGETLTYEIGEWVSFYTKKADFPEGFGVIKRIYKGAGAQARTFAEVGIYEYADGYKHRLHGLNKSVTLQVNMIKVKIVVHSSQDDWRRSPNKENEYFVDSEAVPAKPGANDLSELDDHGKTTRTKRKPPPPQEPEPEPTQKQQKEKPEASPSKLKRSRQEPPSESSQPTATLPVPQQQLPHVIPMGPPMNGESHAATGASQAGGLNFQMPVSIAYTPGNTDVIQAMDWDKLNEAYNASCAETAYLTDESCKILSQAVTAFGMIAQQMNKAQTSQRVLHDGIKARQSQLGADSEKMELLTKQNRSLSKQLEELQEQLANEKKQSEGTKTELEKKTKDLTDLQTKLATFTVQCNKMKESFATCRKEKDAKVKELEEKTKELEEKTKEAAKWKAEFERLSGSAAPAPVPAPAQPDTTDDDDPLNFNFD